MTKSNAQLVREINRLRQRLAHLEDYIITLSKWVLKDAPQTPSQPPAPSWAPPVIPLLPEAEPEGGQEDWSRQWSEQESGSES